VTQESHVKIAGHRAKPLDDLLYFAGKYNSYHSWIGISAIITDETVGDIAQFIDNACKYGVNRLRFIFSEPSGRALRSGMTFHNKKNVELIKEAILGHAKNKYFASISINNPFELCGGKSSESSSSCLLRKRNLLSFSSSGGVYSCCFNVYDNDHYLGNINQDIFFSMEDQREMFADKCKGLAKNYWQFKNTKSMCPISFLELK
jgi:sulfatase maturation enzyme AslB (radical SAM superfamily)